MSEEVDKLKQLIGDTQREVVSSGSCFLFHKWSRWVGTPEHQTRHCLKCSKQEEIDKRCKHNWVKDNYFNHSQGELIKATEQNYYCPKCAKHKRVMSYALGEVTVEYY